MKVSVIMVDGGFRENTYGANYFVGQDFPEDQYEIIWVEYYDRVNKKVRDLDGIKIIELGRTGIYHSSYCFNAGISAAKGDVIVIPDADQIVDKSFLKRVYENHSQINNLVCYGFRYDETESGVLQSHDLKDLKKNCKLKNPSNYGGCLTVRRELLLKINGYEQHEAFESGFHANGLDLYTRFKNLGLPIMWDKELILYHPWHAFTLSSAVEYDCQKAIINWRAINLQYMALNGIDKSMDSLPTHKSEIDIICEPGHLSATGENISLLRRIVRKLKSHLC